MKFPLRISSVNLTKLAETADLITLTGEILNGKLIIGQLANKLPLHRRSKVYQYSIDSRSDSNYAILS